MSKLTKALTAAAGNAGESLYVEDVFSTYLYDGNGSTQTITNGIDLAGEGGLTWVKSRTNTGFHFLFDTERGALKALSSELTDGEISRSGSLTAFNSNGFSLGSFAASNGSGQDYASWSFRKAEKFFDVVNGLTSDGSGNMPEFSHSLGSTPGCVFLKATDSGSNWVVFHKGLSSNGANQYIQLNQTNAATNATGFGIATDTTFEVGAGSALIPSVTYVAYLFASDAGGFGDNGSENIITCSSFTVSSGSASVTLGYEPQFVIVKAANGTGNWLMFDSMRGMGVGTNVKYLQPNTSNAEGGGTDFITPTATGFEINNLGGTQTFIYIALRRPMKTPESGTEVFNFISRTGTGAAATVASPILTDVLLAIRPTENEARYFLDRMRGGLNYLNTTSSSAEGSNAAAITEFGNDTIDLGGSLGALNSNGTAYLYYLFQRAAGFMDVVAYTGNGTAGTTYTHNLSVAPEMMIVKVRSIVEPWVVYHTGLNGGVTPQNYHIRLTNGVEAADSDIWNNTAPTSSVFTTGGNDKVNRNTSTYIAYLFATLAGVSKVGSYTGTGSDLNVDCGFASGVRFVLIKRTDSTGDWYVWDSSRGIVVGNDPYLLLNSATAQVTNTDYIDPLSSGFTVTSSAPAALNASGGSYIFLAIA